MNVISVSFILMGNDVGGLQPPPRSMQIAPKRPLHRRGLAVGLILSRYGVFGGYPPFSLIGCWHLFQEPAIFFRHADCATRFCLRAPHALAAYGFRHPPEPPPTPLTPRTPRGEPARAQGRVL